jgi:hypothetical protein
LFFECVIREIRLKVIARVQAQNHGIRSGFLQYVMKNAMIILKGTRGRDAEILTTDCARFSPLAQLLLESGDERLGGVNLHALREGVTDERDPKWSLDRGVWRPRAITIPIGDEACPELAAFDLVCRVRPPAFAGVRVTGADQPRLTVQPINRIPKAAKADLEHEQSQSKGG